MKIGLVAEGSYPFVRGGVSSWIHMLMTKMPEHQFELLVIMPTADYTEKQYKYELPSNVSGVTIVGLQEGTVKKRKEKMSPLTENELKLLIDWVKLSDPNPEALRIMGERIPSPSDFFSSSAFYELVQQNYTSEGGEGSFSNYLWMFRSMYDPVFRLLQESFPKVDVIHAVSTGYAGLVASYIATRDKTPFLLTEHGIYPREREEEILQANWIAPPYKNYWIRFYYHLSKQAYRMADQVITLFEKSRDHQLVLGAERDKTMIIPNGVDYERLHALPEVAKDPSHVVIGAIVRVVPIKDIKTMIHAAALLRERGRTFEWIIMGPLEEEPEYADECLAIIEQYQLQSFVKMVGSVAIADYLPKMDIGVLSSISEGQPLALLEGMAAGVPFVSTDVGSCEELLMGREEDPFGIAGFVVPPVDPMQMAERIEWLMDHQEERVRFGKNGQKRVEAYYQIPQFIQAYQELYHSHGGVAVGGNRI